jgi:hypothetical protein
VSAFDPIADLGHLVPFKSKSRRGSIGLASVIFLGGHRAACLEHPVAGQDHAVVFHVLIPKLEKLIAFGRVLRGKIVQFRRVVAPNGHSPYRQPPSGGTEARRAPAPSGIR